MALLATRAFVIFLWLCIIAAAVALAIGWLYPQDLRENFRPLMLLNAIGFLAQVFGYHIGLACLGAAAIALVLKRWRLALVALLVALPATVPDWWSYRSKTPPPVAGQTLRIASVNVLFMNYSPHYILPELERIDADVLLLQEWHAWHDEFITPELSEIYPYQLSFPDVNVRGMAIFSKRPLLEMSPPDTDFRLSPHGMRLQRVVIEHEGRPLVIYNVHPVSPAGLGRIVWGQRQTAELIDEARRETLPVILAGDFNATPQTSNLQALEAMGMTEVHALAGRGRGDTWPKRSWKRRLPGFRIDHIFLPLQMSATVAEVGQYHGSDHHGVFADIGWRDSRGAVAD